MGGSPAVSCLILPVPRGGLIAASLLTVAIAACSAPPASRPVLVDAQTFELQRIIEEVHRQSGVPALAAAWVRSDGASHGAIAGRRSIGARDAARIDDRFPIGAITQQFTEAVVVSLIEEGRLHWDSTLEEVVPDLARDIRPEHRATTLEQLLTHRTRIAPLTRGREEPSFDGPVANQMNQRGIVVRWALGRPAAVSDAGGPAYADINLLTAVHMAERRMSTPLESMLTERLLKRLASATDCSVSARAEAPDAMAMHVGTPGAPAAAPSGSPDVLPPAFAPAAGMRCSIESLAGYARVQLRGLRGVNQAITAAGFQRLHTPAADAAPAPSVAGGILGTRVGQAAASTVFESKAGRRAMWQAARAQSYAAWVTLLPDEDLAVVVAANAGYGDQACARATREVLASLGVALP